MADLEIIHSELRAKDKERLNGGGRQAFWRLPWFARLGFQAWFPGLVFKAFLGTAGRPPRSNPTQPPLPAVDGRPRPKGIVESLSKLRGAVQKEQKEEKEIAEKVGGPPRRRPCRADETTTCFVVRAVVFVAAEAVCVRTVCAPSSAWVLQHAWNGHLLTACSTALANPRLKHPTPTPLQSKPLAKGAGLAGGGERRPLWGLEPAGGGGTQHLVGGCPRARAAAGLAPPGCLGFQKGAAHGARCNRRPNTSQLARHLLSAPKPPHTPLCSQAAADCQARGLPGQHERQGLPAEEEQAPPEDLRLGQGESPGARRGRARPALRNPSPSISPIKPQHPV